MRDLFIVLLAALSTAACEGSTGPADCTAAGVGAVTIGAGLTPEITWAADCPAETLAVFVLASGEAAWQLRGGSSGIAKPVTYGHLPAGVTEEHSPEALQAGTGYGVFVTMLTSAGRVSTVADFTP